MHALLWLLRIGAYLFHLILGLFLVGLGVASWSSGSGNLTLGMLPWKGVNLTWAVIALGVVGIVCVLLAATGAARWIFPLWALLVFVMMFRGFFLTGYSFPDSGQFHAALWLTGGAFVAFLVSLSLFSRKRRSGY